MQKRKRERGRGRSGRRVKEREWEKRVVGE